MIHPHAIGNFVEQGVVFTTMTFLPVFLLDLMLGGIRDFIIFQTIIMSIWGSFVIATIICIDHDRKLKKEFVEKINV